MFKGGGCSVGKVIQGFPEKQWNESPFVDSIPMVINYLLDHNKEIYKKFIIFILIIIIVLSTTIMAFIHTTTTAKIFHIRSY